MWDAFHGLKTLPELNMVLYTTSGGHTDGCVETHPQIWIKAEILIFFGGG